jgi:putative ABC transport system ATP-binding protein
MLTGNLDLERGEEVRDLIWRTARSQHSTVLIATHNPDIARTADRILKIADGQVVSIERTQDLVK